MRGKAQENPSQRSHRQMSQSELLLPDALTNVRTKEQCLLCSTDDLICVLIIIEQTSGYQLFWTRNYPAEENVSSRLSPDYLSNLWSMGESTDTLYLFKNERKSLVYLMSLRGTKNT